MTLRLIIGIVCIIVLSSFVYADTHTFYADVTADVKVTGDIVFDGLTNYDNFTGSSSQFTSKNGNYWVINLSTKDSFSDAILRVELPDNVVINYVKTPPTTRIIDGGGITIISTYEDEPVSMIIQYSYVQNASNSPFILMVIFSLLFIIVLFALVYVYGSKKPSKKVIEEIDLSILTDREKVIVQAIKAHGGSITQSVLQNELNLPKSSLSRNIHSLESKQIIEIHDHGMTNMIVFRAVPHHSGKD